MNTPAHAIFGLAAFGRPGRPAVTAAAFAGGLVPDISLFVMVGWARFVMDVPAGTIFRQYYYSDAWMSVFAVDNSFLLWGLLLGLALWRGWEKLTAFAGAGLLHLACDFPLHNHDARPQFWPLTDWVFRSPFSYWDNSHHAAVIEPLEIGACVVLTALILWRFRSWAMRAGALVLLAMEFFASGIWRFLL